MNVVWLLPLLFIQVSNPSMAIPSARKATVVCILPVQGEIDALTVSGLATRLTQAKNSGADAIVLKLDTPGGDLLATLELCRQIKSEYPPNTVAWIKPRAYSAGVITALACREIVVAPQAVLGDAAPISALPVAGLISLPAAERAKLEAPLLSEVTDSSRRSGHDERLARAFVCVGDELWLVEDAERGERYIVDVNEYKIVFGKEPIRMRGGAPSATPDETDESADVDQPQSAMNGQAPLDAAGEKLAALLRILLQARKRLNTLILPHQRRRSFHFAPMRCDNPPTRTALKRPRLTLHAWQAKR